MKRLSRPVTSRFMTMSDVILKTLRYMWDSDIPVLAGSLAYATVLSLIPLLSVSLSVFSALGGLESLFSKIEPFILENLVHGSGLEATRTIRYAIQRVHSGALGISGVIGLLFVSTKLFHDIETSVQKVWQVTPSRRWSTRILVYWGLIFAGPLALATLLGILGSQNIFLLALIPAEAIGVSIILLGFILIYKFVPGVPVAWRSASISALIATVGIWLAQQFYAEVTSSLLNYNKIYGSLASIPIFLLWILVLWWICLGGVALCAVLEKRR